MWVNALAELDIKTSNHFYPWLARPYSVSATMKQLCNNLSVQVISQQLGIAEENEQQLLAISEANSLIRQVCLKGDNVDWSHGRVIVPQATYKKYRDEFDNLGSNLIGETLLYNKSNIQRGSFQYAQIIMPQQILYARRSLFSINSDNLIVMEMYLPSIPAYPD